MSVYEAGACLIGEAPGLCLYRVLFFFPLCLSSLLLKYLLLNTHHGRSKGRRRRFPTGVDHPGGGSRQVHNTTLEWQVSLVSIAQRDLPGAISASQAMGARSNSIEIGPPFSRLGGLCWACGPIPEACRRGGGVPLPDAARDPLAAGGRQARGTEAASFRRRSSASIVPGG